MPTKRLIDNMVDLETGDNKPGAAIVSVGAVFFDPFSLPLGKEFYQVVYAPSCEAAGLRFTEDTLAWWAQQAPEVRKVMDLAHNRRRSKPLDEVLHNYSKYLQPAGPQVRVWGNGSDFDNPILVVAYDAVGLPLPWKFWNSRCFRTVKTLPGTRGLAPKREGTFHNALDDAKHQARHAIAVLSRLGAAT
jgi:hypothetical protein